MWEALRIGVVGAVFWKRQEMNNGAADLGCSGGGIH